MFLSNFKYGFIFLVICCLFTGCSQRDQRVNADVAPSAETSKQIERFNQMGDDVYSKTLEGEFLQARTGIIQMNTLIPKMRLDGVTTPSGIKALSDTLVQAITVFNAVQLDTEQALFQSARIRLMADALSHPNTPLWLQFNKVIQEDLYVMDQASKQEKLQNLKQAFTQMKVHYLTIQPALQVSLQDEENNKLVRAIHNVQNELQASSISPTSLNHAIKALRVMMEDLFQIKSEATTYLPFMDTKEPVLHWVIVLSAIILIILCFVAWRMRVTRNNIITIRRP